MPTAAKSEGAASMQVVNPLDRSEEAKHTAALVNELSAEMCRVLKVFLSPLPLSSTLCSQSLR